MSLLAWMKAKPVMYATITRADGTVINIGQIAGGHWWQRVKPWCHTKLENLKNTWRELAMSRFKGECVCPGDREVVMPDQTRLLVKKGEKLPDAGEKFAYLFGELRTGDLAPQAGTYCNNVSGTEYTLKAGEPFPAEEAGSDFILVR